MEVGGSSAQVEGGGGSKRGRGGGHDKADGTDLRLAETASKLLPDPSRQQAGARGCRALGGLRRGKYKSRPCAERYGGDRYRHGHDVKAQRWAGLACNRQRREYDDGGSGSDGRRRRRRRVSPWILNVLCGRRTAGADNKRGEREISEVPLGHPSNDRRSRALVPLTPREPLCACKIKSSTGTLRARAIVLSAWRP